MHREMIRRPRYLFDRALGVIINLYIIVAIVYIIDQIVTKVA